MVPIIIVHRGNQKYLRCCVSCAKRAGNRVVLIGDESNRQLGEAGLCEWHDVSEYKSDAYDRFSEGYVHMSTNPERFELICFERYYLTYEYIKSKGIDKFVMMDSDVCLFYPVDEGMFSGVSFACALPKQKHEWQWVASPHFSYWTIEAIADFTEFLIETYRAPEGLNEKWEWHKKSHTPGGICDMTLLYLFCRKTKLNFMSTFDIDTLVFDNTLSDLSINGREYEKNAVFDIKRMVLDEKGKRGNSYSPCYVEKNTGKLCPVLYVHAQGSDKCFMNSIFKMRMSTVSYLMDYQNYWIRRIYEKIMRTLGREKRFSWK